MRVKEVLRWAMPEMRLNLTYSWNTRFILNGFYHNKNGVIRTQ